FSLIDMKGKTRTLSELKGKVVFINFWATWCPPCIKELPSMQSLYNKLKGEDFEMLALLNNDTMDKAFTFANRNGIDIPILDDSQNKVGIKYSLTGLPETYIIDKQGIVGEKFIGPAEWDSPENIKMIQKYIDQE
ncbi:MAG: TlpA family protein disulfide reductase, partial [Proteobacteria bacterium]|nr:TlpA family protein disulfide reductase [Pseudomonadota bacterium]